jgi:hypothetical protein
MQIFGIGEPKIIVLLSNAADLLATGKEEERVYPPT